MLWLWALVASTQGVPECAVDPWVRPGRERRPVALARSYETYVAPPLANRSSIRMDGSTALVFVHVSKCGGTTVKRALASATARLGLDPPYTLFRRTWPKFLEACRRRERDCRRDLYVGTNSFGACEYVQKARCVYVTVLRDPIARLVSSWRYFCGQGAENRKGWQRGWPSCLWSLADWAALQPALATIELSTVQAPTVPTPPANQSADCPLLADAPATRRLHAAAHLDAALANIHDGPVFALALETLADGLRRLARALALPLDPLAVARDTRNANRLDARPLADADLAALRDTLALDLALYAALRARHPPP